MKILVTGSNGLLGQKLVYLLSSKSNVELLATSKGDNRLILKKGYSYQPLDITNKKDLDRVVDRFNPDVIINTAAMTNVDMSELNHKACWELNAHAVQNLIQASERNNIHLIHLSTDFVFDGEEGPYKEEDKPNPMSYYGKSKYEAEKMLQASDIKWSIIRTILVYGVTENMSRSNIVLWAKESLEKNQPIKVVEDQYRMPTLAEDLAEGCWLIAQKQNTGIYHISGKDFMSILDLVYKVADYYNLEKSNITPVKSITLNQPAMRPPKTGFFLEKAMHDLGYNPSSFADGLKFMDNQMGRIS